MDFTLKIYKRLLNTLINQGISFSTFDEFIQNSSIKVAVLRHDVDALPVNSLQFARIQGELGIRGTYYFRTMPQSYDENIIKEIHSLGHEIGYHYEDVSLAAQRQKRPTRTTLRRQNDWRLEEYLASIAIEGFKENLKRLRVLAPVTTICMHGSPMSRWDSRLLWKYYDYNDFGIIGEPYFDIDFDQVFYLTDTGRRWNGDSFNLRDKATGFRRKKSGHENILLVNQTPHNDHHTPFPEFHSTIDIIQAAENSLLPDKIMMTFHPQRWTDKAGPWVKELLWQNIKNSGKYFINRLSKKG